MPVIELRDRAGFTVESLMELRIGRKRRRQDFDGDDAIEPRVARFVDLAHAAGTECGLDFVGPEPRAGGKAHFFSPAVQLMTTVIGESGASVAVLTRNFRPSRLGT